MTHCIHSKFYADINAIKISKTAAVGTTGSAESVFSKKIKNKNQRKAVTTWKFGKNNLESENKRRRYFRAMTPLTAAAVPLFARLGFFCAFFVVAELLYELLLFFFSFV